MFVGILEVPTIQCPYGRKWRYLRSWISRLHELTYLQRLKLVNQLSFPTDMKIMAIVYLEVIRRMMINGTRLRRNVHLVFVPAEETGGKLGMKLFVKTKAFEELNIGIALDEASATLENDTIHVHNNERVRWFVTVNCTGDPGHASNLFNNTAAEKFRIILDKFSDLRKLYNDRWDQTFATLGKTVSINLTILKVIENCPQLKNRLVFCFMELLIIFIISTISI